jgi:hypothetical protein
MADTLVRARINGFEKNVGRAFAETTVGVEILDESTTNPDGTYRATTRVDGRPVKKKTTVAESAAAKKASAKKTAARQAVTASADNTKEQDQ